MIVPINKNVGWLSARELVRDMGGLPSNLLHDEILMRRPDDLLRLNSQKYYGAWAREVVVHPEKNTEFKKGKDLIDQVEDREGKKWTFPASSIPEAAIGRKGVSLFVDPKDVEVDYKRVVILAEQKSIVVLTPFIQNNDEVGKVHETTRMPLYVEIETRERLLHDQIRKLFRTDGASVRPIVRYNTISTVIIEDCRNCIFTIRAPDTDFGAGWTLEWAA
jgi:hypothetical protein